MPPLGVALSGVSFSDMGSQIGTAPDGMPVVLKYGAFFQTIFDFIIIAFILFLALKGINKLKKPAPVAPAAAPPAPPRNEVLLEEIRDLLKKQVANLSGRPASAGHAASARVGECRARQVFVACSGNQDIVLDANAAAGPQGFHEGPVHRIRLRPGTQALQQAVDEIQAGFGPSPTMPASRQRVSRSAG